MEAQQEEIVNKLIEDYETPRLLDLFFSPRSFFNKTIVEGKNLYLKIVTIIVGIAATMDQVDQEMLKIQGGKQSAIAVVTQTWWAYWAFCIGLGIISSFFIWYFGGWWYRKRLEFSGAESPDPFKARYIYIYASFIHSAPSVIAALIFTSLYSNYIEAYTKDSFLGIVVVVFIFISLITSYIGASTVFVLSKWKARLWLIVLPAIFYLLIIGALGFLFAKINSDQYRSTEIVPGHRVITSVDNLFSIKLPANWSILKDLNDEAVIQIGNLDENVYCIAFSEPKIDFETGFTLDEFYEAVINGTSGALQKVSVKKLPQLSSFKLDHRRARIDGEIEYNEITYIVQIVETKDNFYQIISYTPKDNAENLLPLFDQITNSFKEL